MIELIVLAPAVAGGAIIAFLGRRLLARAGLPAGAARATAVAAALAAAGAWGIFAIDGALYALGDTEPTYYDFSAYQQYRDTTSSLWFFPISLGYALFAAGLALAAAVVWKRVHPSAGVALAAAACVAVVLPGIVPTRLDRVEYGVDPVPHLADGGLRAGRETGRATACFEYSGRGAVPAGPRAGGAGAADPVRPRARRRAVRPRAGARAERSGYRAARAARGPGGRWAGCGRGGVDHPVAPGRDR